jgi:hypothetical protein
LVAMGCLPSKSKGVRKIFPEKNDSGIFMGYSRLIGKKQKWLGNFCLDVPGFLLCVCMRAACIQYNALYIYIHIRIYDTPDLYSMIYLHISELSPFCGDHPKQSMEVLGTGLAIRRLGAGPWFMAFPLVGITVSKSQCLLCFFWTLEISKSENHD